MPFGSIEKIEVAKTRYSRNIFDEIFLFLYRKSITFSLIPLFINKGKNLKSNSKEFWKDRTDRTKFMLISFVPFQRLSSSLCSGQPAQTDFVAKPKVYR